MVVYVKRVYDAPDVSDGVRILVDRLWPRGLSKDKAHIDSWVKDIAPSGELRLWFNHDVTKWDEFVRRYHAELAANTTAVDALRHESTHAQVTLLYAAKDTEHNNALALKTYLENL